MTQHHERIFFGITSIFASSVSLMGAIMTDGEARWIYVTMAVSGLVAGFLSLMFKARGETIRSVVGRSGIAILGGIFATKPIMFWMKIQPNGLDVIELGAAAGLVTILTFFVGRQLLFLLDRKAPGLAQKIIDKIS